MRAPWGCSGCSSTSAPCRRCWCPDDATGAAHRVAWDKVTVVEVFQRFIAHHRIEVRFCNPGAGNEKGSVENAVGFLRRNVMVPLPNAESYAQLTRFMLSRCDRIAADPHYRKGNPVRDLFGREREAMAPMPGTRFDACRWEARKADGEGCVSVDSHRYLAGPSWHGWTLDVGLRAFDVEIRTQDGRTVARLPRAYGAGTGTVRDPAVLLPALARKPRAWCESPIRGDFPDKLRLRIDVMDSGDRQRTLRLIAKASDASGFGAATAAAEHLVEQGHGIDEASLMALARRIAAGETPHEEPAPDLRDYDRFMRPADDRKEA